MTMPITTLGKSSPQLGLPELATQQRSWLWYAAWGGVLLLLAGSWQGADMRPLDLWRDSGNMATYLGVWAAERFGMFDRTTDGRQLPRFLTA